jgi:uridine kinase
MQIPLQHQADVLHAIDAVRSRQARVVVGISGFGGSGKSTLARSLVESVASSARIRGDDFLDPDRSHQRSDDWDGVERLRLREEVLDPFRAGRASVFRRFDWSVRQLGAPEVVPNTDVLIVDAVGLFHPELDGALDVQIWVDVDLATATERGKARDRSLGRDHDQLWDTVWAPNDRDFMQRFRPDLNADILYRPEQLTP